MLLVQNNCQNVRSGSRLLHLNNNLGFAENDWKHCILNCTSPRPSSKSSYDSYNISNKLCKIHFLCHFNFELLCRRNIYLFLACRFLSYMGQFEILILNKLISFSVGKYKRMHFKLWNRNWNKPNQYSIKSEFKMWFDSSFSFDKGNI